MNDYFVKRSEAIRRLKSRRTFQTILFLAGLVAIPFAIYTFIQVVDTGGQIPFAVISAVTVLLWANIMVRAIRTIVTIEVELDKYEDY